MKENGTASFTVENGQLYLDGQTSIFILGKTEYIVLASVCDEKGELTGDILTRTLEAEDIEPSTARIVVSQNMENTTSTMLVVKFEPDAEIDHFYAVPFLKEDYDANYKDLPKPELWKRVLAFSEQLKGEQTKQWKDLKPATDYYMVVYGMVGDIPTEIKSFPVRTGEPQMALPTVEMTLERGSGENGYEAHSSLIVRMKATDIAFGTIISIPRATMRIIFVWLYG